MGDAQKETEMKNLITCLTVCVINGATFVVNCVATADEEFGACCVSETGACFGTTSAHCAIEGGHWQGDGTTCEEGTCLWACCLDTGDCVQVLDMSECWDLGGGLEYGDCGDGPCADYAPGACCFGDDSCTNEMGWLCELMGGEFQGGGTDCDSITCGSAPIGACCISDENCVPTTYDDCVGGRLGVAWI
jgi:hypothetical protein